MILSGVLLAGVLAVKPKQPDVFIAVASMSIAPGIREAETLVIYQPGALAVPLGRSVAMRPYVSVRAATETGRSASIGVQFVWVRIRR